MVAAVNTRTQVLVVAVLAVVLIRVAWTGEYLRFVATWMQWPLVVTGVIMLAMAARPALSTDRGNTEAGPRSAWLLPLLSVGTAAVYARILWVPIRSGPLAQAPGALLLALLLLWLMLGGG